MSAPYEDFDYVVMGEGEEAIVPILSGKWKRGIHNMPRIENLDSIPYPAWDMVDEPFSTTLFPGERYGDAEKAATIIASRGCPYNCHFCGNMYRAPVFYRSVENIIGELKELIKRRVRHFRFEDDNFTLHPQFAVLCAHISKLNIHYKCHTRSNLLDDEQAAYLKSSGCEECGLGVESADDKVLRLNNKAETASDHLKAIGILRNAGILSKTYFIAGLPGETDETLRINMEFFKKAKPDKWTLSTFTPYPGCAVYKNPDKFGIKILNWNWLDWWNFVQDRFVHVLDGQTSVQMWERYQKFYNFLKGETWMAKS